MAMNRIMKSDKRKKAGSTSRKRQRKAVAALEVRAAATGAFVQIDSKQYIAFLEPPSLLESAQASTGKVSRQFADNAEEATCANIPFARWNNGMNI